MQPIELIVKDPDILGGTAVFRGTRVPFQALVDYLEGGQTLDEFLDDFPTGIERSSGWRARHGDVAVSQPVGMKVLLDVCIPRKLKNSLVDHECQTVPEAGLAGQKNGRLLSLAESAGSEVFLTMDKGVQYQQNLCGRNLAILIIRSKSNRLADLLPHVAECLSIISIIEPGEVIRVGE